MLLILSAIEAEFIATNEAAREVIWLRELLSGIGFQCRKATTLHVDNQSDQADEKSGVLLTH